MAGQAANTGVEVVLFDVGATLVDNHPSAQHLIVRVLGGHGFDPTAVDLARAQGVALQAVAHLTPFQRYGQEESRAFWDAFYRALLSALAIPDDAALRRALYEEFQQLENWRLFDDAVPTLERLRADGYRLGVVSNWEEWLEDLLIFLDIHPLFEAIVASGPFGRAKPHPSIFQRALEATRATPEAAVHVGDSLRDDVGGARAAGLRPILIDRHDRHAAADVERIRSLAELPAVLRAGGAT